MEKRGCDELAELQLSLHQNRRPAVHPDGLPLAKKVVSGFRFFTVYDGHAGEQAVSMVKQILPNILAAHLQQETDVKKALCEVFKAVDAELTKSLLETASNASAHFSSGTVACMALVKGKELWLANLGDCRAILCKEGHKAQTITTDHAPAKSEAEAERLRQLGVDVRGGYVGEHIAVSRAFGNVCFATGKKLAGAFHEPEVHLLEIDDRTDFLILGSDGIWDPLKAQFVVTHARKALRTTEKP